MLIINKNKPPFPLRKPTNILCGLILILISVCFTNCASILYGYKKVTNVDEKWSNELAAIVGVDPQHVVFLDSLETVNLVKLVCNSNQSVQPMQLHCVIGDSIVSSYFNCYARSNLRNLHWSFENLDHNLVDGDCFFSHSDVNIYLRDLVKIKKGDLLIAVISSMFKRQSEHLVKIAAIRSPGFTLVLVNIDSYYKSVFNK